MGFTRNLLATFIVVTVTVTPVSAIVVVVERGGGEGRGREAYKTICAQSKLGSLNDLRSVLLALALCRISQGSYGPLPSPSR